MQPDHCTVPPDTTSFVSLNLCPLGSSFQADEHKFVPGGREDIDVRMLGTGRPFVLELLNPKVETV